MHSTSDEHEWHTFCSAPSAANISQRPFASTLENLQIICKTPVSPKIRYFCPEPSSTGAALLQFRFFSKVGGLCLFASARRAFHLLPPLGYKRVHNAFTAFANDVLIKMVKSLPSKTEEFTPPRVTKFSEMSPVLFVQELSPDEARKISTSVPS